MTINTAVMAIGAPAFSASFTQPTSAEISMAAIILGLSSDALACVDVQPNEVPTVLDRLSEEYSSYAQLLAKQEDAKNAEQLVMECKNLLRNDPQNATLLQQLQDAQYNATTAHYLAAQIREGLLNTVLDELADPSMIDEVFFRSGVYQSLSPAYRLAADTFEEAKSLAWALECQRDADSSGSSMPSEASTVLNTANSQYDVNTGLIRMQQYSSGNEAAFQQWVVTN